MVEPDRVGREDYEAVERARRLLLEAGADRLPRPPWSHPNLPPGDATLVGFALWRANAAAGHASRNELQAALRLLASARSDLESLESALLLVARAEGLTWPEIAAELGVHSPQAAQQRHQRLSSRLASDGEAEGVER